MNELKINFLGNYQIKVKGTFSGEVRIKKASALLAFLAIESNRTHQRSALAELFWPNKPEGAGKNNLKQVLSNLRKSLGDREASSPFLLVEREWIQFNSGSNYWTDILEFTELNNKTKIHTHDSMEACKFCASNLEKAINLYQGDFLEQFSLSDSLQFEEWIITNRESFQRQMCNALKDLIAYEKNNQGLKKASEYANRVVTLEPWSEEAHRESIRLLAQIGHRGTALKQYQYCIDKLESELGVDPSQETKDLHQKILDREFEKTQKIDVFEEEIIPEYSEREVNKVAPWVSRLVVFALLGAVLFGGKTKYLEINNSDNSQGLIAAEINRVPIEISDAEIKVLEILYNETEGGNWFKSDGWLSESSPCDWYGIECDDESMIGLFLKNNNLSGNIPPELSLLGSLKILNLSHNYIIGNIPPELGDLKNLEMLDLKGNPQLGGPIPSELGNLENLDALILSGFHAGTQISGSIPPELGNLRKLTWLELANALLTGPIPPELGNLTNLMGLDLGTNSLSGSIPTEFGNLVNLQILSVGKSKNDLSGPLPNSLINLKKLRIFEFDETNICEPPDVEFQAWLEGIEELYRTNELCN